ncbi:hypothetical protein [Segetibacter aerophilus]|uniref:Beta-lactamase-inhibitor-like PepSY-like domain-containing protein n=1 Tax=Segetibacter aerophilus TaxID=670293 RepID=A0A512BBQ3_9BACT|nr:hypothetical protein [Segetibacter aerophilus]GEO09413.1 hypothetical protein SAE01_19090 [Segetibacter aerophilus]
MKSIFFTLLLAFLVTAKGHAAPAFEKVKIQKSQSLQMAVEQTSKTMSFFDINGKKIEESKKTNENQLPVPAKRTFAKMFDGYEIKQAVRSVGNDGECYFITAENDKESIIVKIDETLEVSVFTKSKK